MKVLLECNILHGKFTTAKNVEIISFVLMFGYQSGSFTFPSGAKAMLIALTFVLVFLHIYKYLVIDSLF
jgi:hypothetical protein